MAAHPGGWPDWRDENGYRPLLIADRAGWAWEWLRRNTDYRKAYERARWRGELGDEMEAGPWGIHRFESPDAEIPFARPLWRRDLLSEVLSVDAKPGGREADRFELDRLRQYATLHRSKVGTEHLLLSDGYRSIRLDVLSGSVGDGPVTLGYRLAGFASVAGPLLSLRRLLFLRHHCRFSPPLHRSEVKARRWMALLRAGDALALGATQREIAEFLLKRSTVGPRWRVSAPSLRSRAQRLVRGAREMSEGAYLRLLQFQ